MRRMTARWAAGCAAACVAAAVGFPAAASAVPKYTDNYNGNPDPLTPSTVFVYDNSGATIQTSEPFTPNGAGSCAKTGTSRDMYQTLWWKITGTGGRIIVSTRGSAFDSLLTIYNTAGTPSVDNDVDCSDNATGDDATVTLNTTTAGAQYLIQAGTCANYYDAGWFDCGWTGGELKISAVTNDERAQADPSTSGARANIAALTDTGEVLTCNGAPYGSTVWFRYTAAKHGWVNLTASRFDTVISLYRGSDAQPAACSDGARPDDPLTEKLRHYVTPGEYFIQIGGKDYGSFNAEDNFTYELAFEEDLDLDKDGSNRPEDCDDGNAGIRPGKPDVPHNGVDEDCVGGDNKDEDGDKHNAASAGGGDCNDKDATINPTANEKPNNGVDENCDGRDDAARLPSTPQVSFRSQPFGRGVVFGTMYVRDLRRGYRVEVRCKRSRSCPRVFRKKVGSKRSVVLQKFRRRAFRTGAKIEVFVTTPGNVIGFYKRYVVRGRKNPKQTICDVQPGTTRKITRCR